LSVQTAVEVGTVGWVDSEDSVTNRCFGMDAEGYLRRVVARAGDV